MTMAKLLTRCIEYRMKHMSWEGKNNGKVEGKGGMRWDPKKEIKHI